MSEQTTPTDEASVVADDATVVETVLTAQDNTVAGEVKDEAGAEDSSKSEETIEETKEETKEEVVAVDYDNLELPEGYEMDATALDAAKPIFEELGLDQKGVQALVGLMSKIETSRAEATATSVSGQAETWVGEVKEEWGGAYDANVEIAKKAVALGGEELQDALALTGAGNHPAVIKFFHRVGMTISEDTFANGGVSGTTQERPLYEKLYKPME